MEVFLTILRIGLWNGLVPLLIGYFSTYFMKSEDRDNIALNYVFGTMVVFGIFEPAALFAIYQKLSLSFLTNAMQILWGVLSVISVLLNFRRFVGLVLNAGKVFKGFTIMMAVVMVLIFVQAYVYVGYEHVDDDDAFFVATATTAVENNNLYVNSAYSGGLYGKLPTRYILSPFSIYYASLAELTKLHPTIYAHLYLPILMLLFVYSIYYVWGRALFRNSKSVGVFLFFVCLMNLYGNYSEFTTQSFLLFRLWQGKAVLAAGILPFLLYLCYRVVKEGGNLGLWISMFMTVLSACLVSSMGIFLVPITIGTWALVDLIRTRKVLRVLQYATCCLPCVVLGLIYIVIS
jgi:hypothetical protein